MTDRPFPRVKLAPPPASDLADRFKRGHVAPDGSIWWTPRARLKSGVVQIPEAELAKAERFGWQQVERGDAPAGLVRVRRAQEQQ